MNNIILKNFLKNKYLYIILAIPFILGIYLSFIGGYGSDEDTIPMIGVFQGKLFAGQFVSSRFTGYPVPELGIGFLAYFFGSWATNLATYLFFLIGTIFFYFSLKNFSKSNIQNFLIFLILCISNPILFFDNIEAIDYSWAFLFFGIGLFFLSKRKREIAVLFFAFCIGSRINFVVFVLIAYLFIDTDYKLKLFEKIYNFLIVFILGGLFYLPVWFYSKFGLGWLTAARPLEQGFIGLLVRFIYKTHLTFGFFQFFLIFFILLSIFYRKKFISFFKKNNFLLILIISNFLIFLYIPAELSYLQPAIIFFYFLLVGNFNKKISYLLICLNFLSWFVNINYLNIKHSEEGLCAPKKAISASFELSIQEGYLSKYLNTREMIKCWANENDEVGQRIIQGKALRNK